MDMRQMEGDRENIKVIHVKAIICDKKLEVLYQDHYSTFISFTLLTWFDMMKQLNLWAELKEKKKTLAYHTELNQVVWTLDLRTGQTEVSLL